MAAAKAVATPPEAVAAAAVEATAAACVADAAAAAAHGAEITGEKAPASTRGRRPAVAAMPW